MTLPSTPPRLHRHAILTTPTLPPYEGPLYEYWLHGGGVALRAERPQLHACIPLGGATVRGLPTLAPTVTLSVPPVPAGALALMLDRARSARDPAGHPREILFHLRWGGLRWKLDIPPQVGTPGAVQPTAGDAASSYAQALIEVHSHHSMRAYWSTTDDQDEQGFRLYGVLGTIFSRPVLRLRVGVYGVFHEIDPTGVFQLPPELHTTWTPTGDPQP
ncbi:MAG: hypothetical protein M3Z04_05770 [Chloroflexota bacterium]|nr:hypothetical protein [Chloroflexota bacterium]